MKKEVVCIDDDWSSPGSNPIKNEIYEVDGTRTNPMNPNAVYYTLKGFYNVTVLGRVCYNAIAFVDLVDMTDEINEALTAQTPVKKVKEHLLDAHGYLAMPDAVRKWYNDTLPLWP